MNILEQEIEDVVWNAIQKNKHSKLRDCGLPIYENYTYLRQLSFTGYGVADIVGIQVLPKNGNYRDRYREANIQIFELKKEEINVGTFLQAARYARALQRKLSVEFDEVRPSFSYHLIGKSIDTKSGFTYLPDLFDDIICSYTFSIDLDTGIRFKQHYGYSSSSESFPENDYGFRQIIVNSLRQNFQRPILETEPEDLPF